MASILKKKNEDKKESIKIGAISAQVAKKIEKKKLKSKKFFQKRGVLFIKNLPRGFYEEQLEKYFGQFGKVTRLRLVRSRKTGNSRGYAFIEFAVPEVCKVAAETMNNYLMFQKIVKAVYIPPEEQKFNYFKTLIKQTTDRNGKKIYVSRKMKHIVEEMDKYNNWNSETFEKRKKSSLSKLKSLKKKHPNLDIDINKITVGFQPIKEEIGLNVKESESCSDRDRDKKHIISKPSTNNDMSFQQLFSFPPKSGKYAKKEFQPCDRQDMGYIYEINRIAMTEEDDGRNDDDDDDDDDDLPPVNKTSDSDVERRLLCMAERVKRLMKKKAKKAKKAELKSLNKKNSNSKVDSKDFGFKSSDVEKN